MEFSFPEPVVPPPHEYSNSRLDELYQQATTLWPGVSKKSCINAISSEFANGDVQRAAVLLQFYAAAKEGHVTPVRKKNRSYHPLRGAINLYGVTCYLDSLLVAMFSRMEIFEPLLYIRRYESLQVEELATWMRLFVNLLRNGERITGDIVGGLLSTLINAGWQRYELINNHNLLTQQDVAELFVFITSTLKMPLLALKVDIAHAGKEQSEYDHKLVQEQLLYLSVPGNACDPPILLEECLEIYFSNQVSVRRHLERPERQNSLSRTSSGQSNQSQNFRTPFSNLDSEEPGPRRRSYSILSLTSPSRKFSKQSLDEAMDLPSTPKHQTPPVFHSPFDHDSPRGSILSNEIDTKSSLVPETNSTDLPSYTQLFGFNNDSQAEAHARDMKQSLWTSNNEIMLPAWMFLQLMPFYSADVDLNKGESLKNIEATEVAKQFSRQRPVLGLCLKRYFFDSNGQPQRNNRAVVIPEVISLPSFVADDSDQRHAFGKFRLVLESAVFHRGSSIHSGHYCALISEEEIRKPSFNISNRNSMVIPNGWDEELDRFPPHLGKTESFTRLLQQPEINKRWFFFDDLQEKGDRLKEVDFNAVFEKETPYLLFYRMVSLEDEANEEAALQEKYLNISEPVSRVPSPSYDSTPIIPVEVEKKKKKFFRRHKESKDKEKVRAYANRYREEKCVMM